MLHLQTRQQHKKVQAKQRRRPSTLHHGVPGRATGQMLTPKLELLSAN